MTLNECFKPLEYLVARWATPATVLRCVYGPGWTAAVQAWLDTQIFLGTAPRGAGLGAAGFPVYLVVGRSVTFRCDRDYVGITLERVDVVTGARTRFTVTADAGPPAADAPAVEAKDEGTWRTRPPMS